MPFEREVHSLPQIPIKASNILLAFRFFDKNFRYLQISDVIGVASETGINQYEQAISDDSNELTTMSVNDNVDGNFDESTSSNLIISESFSMLLNDENVSSSRFEREDNVWNFHDDFVLTDVGSLSNETIDSEQSNTKNNSDLNSGGGVSSLFLPK